jgi:hypothetical protein
MVEPIRLTGILQATTNPGSKDIKFVLSVSGHEPINCVAEYRVVGQIAAGLGTALEVLRMALAKAGAILPFVAERLQAYHIEKDQLASQVVMVLTTVSGIQYTFQMPSQNAIEIADRLRTEAAKERPMWHG